MICLQGWIKFHRQWLTEPFWRNGTLEQRVIFITLLCMCNHSSANWVFNGMAYTINEGQCVTSVASILDKCNNKQITSQKVRTALKKFEKLGIITIETTNKNTFVSIENWGKYQNVPDDYNKDCNNEVTNNTEKSNNQNNCNLTTNKKEKYKNDKYKNDKENISISNDIDCRTTVQRIIIAWNELETCGIKNVSKITSGTKRYNSLLARIKEYSENDVYIAINNIRNSKFLQGHNKSGWVITFDWFIKPNNFIKVFEGNYNDRTNGQLNNNDEWEGFLNDE